MKDKRKKKSVKDYCFSLLTSQGDMSDMVLSLDASGRLLVLLPRKNTSTIATTETASSKGSVKRVFFKNFSFLVNNYLRLKEL